MPTGINDPKNFMQISHDQKFASELRRHRKANPNASLEEIAAKMSYSLDEQFRENVRRAEQ